MVDAHVHIEKGPYTKEWVCEFIKTAQSREITHLYILEHSHRFKEFKDLYNGFVLNNVYQAQWIEKRMVHSIVEYQDLVNKCRKIKYPIIVKFGLEICFEEECDNIIEQVTGMFDWDFLTGSIHWVDEWGFDHKKEDWIGKDVNFIYEKYYQRMLRLIKTNLFNNLAHPDSIKCFGYNPTIDLKEYYFALARELNLHKMNAEFSCGLFNNYDHSEIGLNRTLLKVFKDEKVNLITASDAHYPGNVGKGIKEAVNILSL
jgi:histidinol-phosphatase (PHP family)